eukprot:Gb_19813 [translate_table: standard]
MMNDEEIPFVQIPQENCECILPAAKRRKIRSHLRYFWCCFGSAEKNMADGQSKSTCFQRMIRRLISVENSTANVEEEGQNWWQKGMCKSVSKAREWPETVADETASCCEVKVKWKSFLRRLKSKGKRIYNRNSKPGRFHYDPLSYALNFDEGNRFEADYSYQSFSARFGTAPVTANPRDKLECGL